MNDPIKEERWPQNACSTLDFLTEVEATYDAGDGTADFSQEMIQLPPIACFQSQRLEKGGPIVALQGLQANLSSRYQILT